MTDEPIDSTASTEAGALHFYATLERHRGEIRNAIHELECARPGLASVLRGGDDSGRTDVAAAELQRQAIVEGRWDGYGGLLTRQGHRFAAYDVPLSDWFDIADASRRVLLPRLFLEHGHDLDRLFAAITAMEHFLDTAGSLVAAAYDAARRGTSLALDREHRRVVELFEAASTAIEQARRCVPADGHLDSVGRLAAGIAQDFNNLVAIVACSAGAIRDVDDRVAREEAGIILDAAHRAGTLTRRLLVLGQCQVLRVEPVDPGELIDDVVRLMRRYAGSRIAVETDLQHGSWLVDADREQLEQALVNLVANACEAMHHGGTLRLQARRIAAGAPPGARQPANDRDTVVIAVCDTGVGMDDSTRQHAFEPFFSTKADGKGLGLATAHAIVHQLGGDVTVDSAPDRGTTVEMRLPRSASEPVRRTTQNLRAAEDLHGSETILLVESDELIRAAACRILESAGYHVIAARRPADALEQAAAHSRPIDLLVIDTDLPHGHAGALSRAFSALHSRAATLFVSGDVPMAAAELPPEVRFLTKPFSAHSLLSAVRNVLDQWRKQHPVGDRLDAALDASLRAAMPPMADTLA